MEKEWFWRYGHFKAKRALDSLALNLGYISHEKKLQGISSVLDGKVIEKLTFETDQDSL